MTMYAVNGNVLHVTPQSFRIVTVERTYYIRADDALTKARWLCTLRARIDQAQ